MTEQIKPVGLFKYMLDSMIKYGKYVLENRSIPDYRDGLKPVQRRVLWAMYDLGLMNSKLVKTARVVGETLGKYHPHGDKSVSDAIETLVQQVTSPIHGEGNWGSIMGDNAAAMRYTLLRLSDYGKLFFDPFYMAVIDKVPTYDGAGEEPVILYPMLPNLLISGITGIGVGATTEIPGFTPKSVIATLVEAATNGGATPAMCAKLLEFSTLTNSVVRKQTQGKALMEFFKTGRVAIRHSAKVVYDAKRHEVIVTGVAPFKGVGEYTGRLLGACEAVDGIASVDDRSKKWSLCVAYPLKKGADGNAVKEAVQEYLSSVKHYKVNVTERWKVLHKGMPSTAVKFKATTIPEIINGWLRWRVELEVRAVKYHMAELDKAIRRNELLRAACRMREYIFGLAKGNDPDSVVKQLLKAKLNCTDEEADFVFNMKWRQLRTLEDKAIAAKMAEQAKLRKEYEQRIAKPGAYVIKHIQSFANMFQ